MDNPNPIKYSDLISPDNSITDLIAQLTALIAKYDEARTRIQSSANEMAKGLQNVSGATEQQRQAIMQAYQETERLAEQYKRVTSEEQAAKRQKIALTQASKEQTQIDKLVVQLNQAEEGSYNRLSAQYRLNKIRLNEMSAAQRAGTEAGRQLERETRAIYEQMSSLQKATGKYTLEVGHYENALRALPGPLGQVSSGLIGLRDNLNNINSSGLPTSVKWFSKFAIGVGLAIKGVQSLFRGLRSGVNTIADFEQANVNLSTILGVNVRDMKALTDSALSLGRATEYTASQVTQLQTELAKLGFGQGSILSMQKYILHFATAMGVDLGEAAEVAGSTLRSFNLSSKDTEDALSVLVEGANRSALSFEKYKTSIGIVFPVAKTFGFSLRDVVALLGSLANAGFDASSAATATRNILLNLADAGGKLAQKLGEPVKTFDDLFDGLIKLRQGGIDLAEALELTDKRSVSAFSTFLEGAESAKTLRAELENVSGVLETIAGERLETVEGSTKLLKSAWEGLILSFRNSAGVIKTLIDQLTSLTTSLTNLLFPKQAQSAATYDEYFAKFTDYYAKEGGKKTLDAIDTFINQYIAHVEALEKIQAREPKFTGWLGIGKPYKDYRKALDTLTDIRKAEAAVREQIEADERAAAEERARQEEKENQDNLERVKQETEKERKIREKAEAKRKADAEKAERARQKAEEQARKDAEAREKAEKQGRINSLQAEQQAIQLQIAITEEGSQEMLKLRLELIEKQRALELEKNRQAAENLRQDEKLINAKYDKLLLKTETEFNNKLAERDLKAQRELAESEFELQNHTERQKTIFRLQQEKARLEAVLKLNETATEKLTADEIQAIKNTIKKIGQEVSEVGYKDIWDLLGIRATSGQKDAFNEVANSVADSIGSIVDSWQKAADAAVESAEKQVEAAKSVLDAEIEARNNGYANNVEQAQKELNLRKKQQAAALAEQEKAQRAQLAIDTITQTSSLITASANIWKSLSGIPVVGPALAVAALATMWGSFAVAKVKATQVAGTGKSEKYGDGTIELLEGGSHASGKDIDLGVKKDGTRRRAEGGEYFAVINKRNSRKFRDVIPDVINSFNDGSFADKYQRANAQMSGYALNYVGGGTDVTQLQRDVKAIREQGDEVRYVDAKGNMIVRYKNLTRKIKS